MDRKNKDDHKFCVPFAENQNSGYQIIALYVREFIPRELRSGRFFKTLHRSSGKAFRGRNNNVGRNTIGKWPSRIAAYLGKPPQEVPKYAGHSFRRTGATSTADAGASSFVTKRWGGWRSNATPSLYVDKSLRGRKEICNMVQRQVRTHVN